MKKNVFGRKFKRDINERKALFKNLISSLILDERIRTTEEKAKAIKGDVDKVITKIKKNGANARTLLGEYVFPNALDKLMDEIAPRFEKRQGGYTRILRIGKRFGDNAMVVIMEWTESEGAASQKKSKTLKPTRSLNERRQSGSKQKPKAKPSRRSVVSQSAKRPSAKKKEGKKK